MPQFSGLRALELLKQRTDLDVPFIIVSGTIGEETAAAAIRQGAADYLLKDRTGRLVSAVKRGLQEVEQRRERQSLEAQFLEAQKMEVLGHLAGGVAHDFNNVLGVIMGYADLATEELGLAHPVHKYVEEIRQAASRAAGLTQQLLIYSRKQTVQAAVIDLNAVIRSMEKLLRQLINENIEMTLSCAEQVGPIKADPGYAWQVLMNLVVNARDAMPNGGKITIGTREIVVDASYAQAHAVERGHYVLLSVSDTGLGMTDEVKAHLFEAFFTTKEKGKGTGLGLVTCQTIVRQSGGQIEVLSKINEGTTFNIYFPRIERSAPPVEAPRKSKTGPLRRGAERLLLVEDDPSLRHLAESVLKAQGYDVLTAPNGHDALRLAREQQGSPISLVVTDVIMPRMGGKVMAEWLKTFYPDLKILFTSGYTEEAIASQGLEEEDVEFLPKPYTPASLARKVRKLLDS